MFCNLVQLELKPFASFEPLNRSSELLNFFASTMMIRMYVMYSLNFFAGTTLVLIIYVEEAKALHFALYMCRRKLARGANVNMKACAMNLPWRAAVAAKAKAIQQMKQKNIRGRRHS